MYENPKLIHNSVHPDWIDYFKEQWKNLLKGEIPPTYEYQMIDKSGKVKWLNQRNVLIKDEEGNIEAVEAIVTDITASKRAEEYMRKSEERYRTLVETSNDGIVVIQDGKFIFFNEVFTDLFGYEGDEVIEMPFVNMVHPDYVEMVTDMYNRRLAGEDVLSTYDFVVIKKDGTEMPIEISVALTEWEDRTATLCFIRDITERERAKKLIITHRVLASTLNAASDLNHALEYSLDVAIEVSSMDSGAIYIINDDNSFNLMAHKGLS